MGDPDRRGERTIALALLGVVLFSKPVLDGFDAGGEHFVFGVPSLYLYLFLAWGALVGLMALVMESVDGLGKEPPESLTSKEHSGPEST